MSNKITSLQHALVKHWIALRKESSYRQAEGKVVLIGEKIIREFHLPIRRLLSRHPLEIPAEEHYVVPEEILQKISGIDYRGAIAEVDLPQHQNLDDKKTVLILDQIQDPGNLGTLLRTALALGWEGVITTPGTVDLFNDKALRASQGAPFRLPFSHKTPEELLLWLEKTDRTLWVADSEGSPLRNEKFSPPLALVLSHEGRGWNEWAARKGKKVAIPLKNNVESLNVAIAGAILLYEAVL